MKLSTSNRNLGRVAAALGLTQGLAWAGMSLAAIILYNTSPSLSTCSTYTECVGVLLYYQFISGNIYSSFIIRPLDFMIYMWIYFILSVGWTAVSIDQFAAITYNKRRQKVIILFWSILTLVVSIIDLIFTSLLGRDYSSCNEVSAAEDCYLAVGIALTIAARGFTLWIVNVVLGFHMLSVALKIKSKDDKLANYFSQHSIPRVPLPNSTTTNSGPRGRASPDIFSDSPLPSFLFQEKFNTQESQPTFRDRGDEGGSKTSRNSFLSRGDRFGY